MAMKPDLPKASEPLICCPECSSDGPFFPMERLVQGFVRDKRVLVFVSGHLLGCQACGEVFAVGPKGKIKRHPNAIPRFGGEVSRAAPDRNGPEPKPELPPRSLPPIPRERPTL